MDDLYSLIVLVAVIWSVIGGLIGGRKGQGGAGGPARGRRPGAGIPAPSPGRSGPRPDTPGDGGAVVARPTATADDAGEEDRSAAAMIPDDLWEILTGERRTPEPEWEPEPWEDDHAWEPHGEEAAPVESYPVPYGYEARSLESAARDEYPVAVSLEAPPPPPEERHRLFHKKLEATARQQRPARRSRLPAALGSGPALRRAMVLREVLGPPKALE